MNSNVEKHAGKSAYDPREAPVGANWKAAQAPVDSRATEISALRGAVASLEANVSFLLGDIAILQSEIGVLRGQLVQHSRPGGQQF